MVLAHHVIFSTYGFWLPNDPRGSWSDYICNFDLLLEGDPTKTTLRHSLATRPHDRQRRISAKQVLRYNPVYFTCKQALCVARGIRRARDESNYCIMACSILPQHVYLVLMRHDHPAERIIGHLKTRATQQLLADGLHPFADLRDAQNRIPSVWAHRAWKVFLNSEEAILRAINYVERNPLKDGKPRQKWSFVRPYA